MRGDARFSRPLKLNMTTAPVGSLEGKYLGDGFGADRGDPAAFQRQSGPKHRSPQALAGAFGCTRSGRSRGIVATRFVPAKQDSSTMGKTAKKSRVPAGQSGDLSAPRGGRRSPVRGKGRAASGSDTGYTARHIEVLEGLEPVRRRPGMYIGGTDEKALHHLFAEAIDNSMDEAI